MGRAGKLAVGAIVGGMGLTIVLMAAVGPPAPRASVRVPIAGTDAHPGLETALRRCRTVTTSDAECEAAWEAKRRHFFGQKRDEP